MQFDTYKLSRNKIGYRKFLEICCKTCNYYKKSNVICTTLHFIKHFFLWIGIIYTSAGPLDGGSWPSCAQHCGTEHQAIPFPLKGEYPGHLHYVNTSFWNIHHNCTKRFVYLSQIEDKIAICGSLQWFYFLTLLSNFKNAFFVQMI